MFEEKGASLADDCKRAMMERIWVPESNLYAQVVPGTRFLSHLTLTQNALFAFSN